MPLSIWSPRWNVYGQSAASLLLKACFASVLRAKDVKEVLADTAAIPISGGSFWRFTVDRARLAAWLGSDITPVWQGPLGSLSLAWLCSSKFKYCPDCLAHGYHAIYFQLQALSQCPVHGIPLVEQCVSCGAPTPKFGLCKELFDKPFICHHCDGLLSGRPVSIRNLFENPAAAEWEARWKPIEGWFQALDQCGLYWGGLHDWITAHPLGGKMQRRVSALHLLSAIEPLPDGYRWSPSDVVFGAFSYGGENRLRRMIRFQTGDVLSLYQRVRQAIEARVLDKPVPEIEACCHQHGWQAIDRHLSETSAAYALWRTKLEGLSTPALLGGSSPVDIPAEAIPGDWEMLTARQWTLVMRSLFASIRADVESAVATGIPVSDLYRLSLQSYACAFPDFRQAKNRQQGVYVFPRVFQQGKGDARVRADD